MALLNVGCLSLKQGSESQLTVKPTKEKCNKIKHKIKVKFR